MGGGIWSGVRDCFPQESPGGRGRESGRGNEPDGTAVRQRDGLVPGNTEVRRGLGLEWVWNEPATCEARAEGGDVEGWACRSQGLRPW